MSYIQHLFGSTRPSWTSCPPTIFGGGGGCFGFPGQDPEGDETGVLNWPRPEEEDQRPGTDAGPGDQGRPDQEWVLAGPKTPGGQAEPKGGFGNNVWDETTFSTGNGFKLSVEWMWIAGFIVVGLLIGKR
jgi:hypothetical protein